MANKNTIVAVTGANGFIASHIVRELLEEGFTVRAVVRDPSNEEKISHLKSLPHDDGQLSFHSGDLLKQGSYKEALVGVHVVVHSAAVVEVGKVKDPQHQIVDPSVKGVENVLGSLDMSTIQMFVHTSSIAAILNADKPKHLHTEVDWNEYSTLSSDAYGFAKTQAEQRVWEWAKGQSKDLGVAVVNPVVVLGQCLCKQHTKSSTVFLREGLYNNGVQPYYTHFVDVRDVAKAHVRCIQRREEATGKRFIITSDSGNMNTTELGAICQKELPQYKISTPSKYNTVLMWLMVGLSYLPFVGHWIMTDFERRFLMGGVESLSNAQTKQVLGIEFTPLEKTCRDGCLSIIEGGWVKPKPARK